LPVFAGYVLCDSRFLRVCSFLWGICCVIARSREFAGSCQEVVAGSQVPASLQVPARKLMCSQVPASLQVPAEKLQPGSQASRVCRSMLGNYNGIARSRVPSGWDHNVQGYREILLDSCTSGGCLALARMVEIDCVRSPRPWARPLHWGFANLLTDVHLGTGHVGPCDLSVMEARVEIRAL
jgi:hypothetical protein